ncbi:TonB-dependent receptor [Pelagerythrobacter marensis]|uniref:Secretin/TonB short N-terminal domain-containing protein n=1 Tax=Pelagerythrobacter marensis TaxID=543877 RepID=A0A0G3X9E1_9SPHN|nr:TonB-dependent receptor [Pelagerythrobacter marensis]AKM07008.1 hypothetical protein AM2010_930 [Pelagerythrobacter marensis]
MQQGIIQGILLGSAAGLAIAIASPAAAQQTSQPAEASARALVNVDVEAQELDTALKLFARQSGADILYAPDLVRGRKTDGVSGSYRVAHALTRLLRGTGLVYREVSHNVFALRVPAAANAEQSVDGAAAALSGRVVNASSGAGLPGARLKVAGTPLETITDQDGRFHFPSVPAGEPEIWVEYLGQPPQTVVAPSDSQERRDFAITVGQTADQIVVRGFRGSLARALNQQLNAANNTTVVSSDLLGSFPAETVSEALRRVPGVAFGRGDDTGEGSRITVRGFSSEAINIQLNGLELQGTGFERTIDLSGFLADNISQITIHKSLLPSHEANGSGGLVEIETKSGLDYGDFQFSLGLEGELGFDRDFGEEYQVNAVLAKKLTPSFGVAATVQYRKTDRLNYDAGISDYLPPVLPDGYNYIFYVPASMQFPFDDAMSGRLINGANYSRRTREEENFTASFNAAWEISDTTTLRFDAQRIQVDQLTNTARTTASFLTSAIDMPIPELDGEVRRRQVLASLRPNLALNVKDIRTTQNTLSLRGTTQLDRWDFKYKAGYSFARSKSNNANLSALGNTQTSLGAIIDPDTGVVHPDGDGASRFVDGAFVLAPNGLPIPSLTAFGFDLLNATSEYNLTSANRTITNSPTESYILEGSARYLSQSGLLDYVEFGAKYDRSSRKSADDLFASTSVGSLASIESYLRVFGKETGLDYFGEGLASSLALGDIGAGGLTLPFLLESSVDRIFEILPSLTQDDPSTPFDEQRFNYTDTRGLDPINDPGALTPARTKEERLAAYIEGKVEFGRFDLVGGVRMERTTRSGTTLSTPSVRTADNVVEPRETFVGAGLVEFSELAGTQTTWTPSALLNYRPVDNVVARLSYNRTTVNPSLRLIRRPRAIHIDLRPTQNRVILREANPDLKPTTTDNYEFDVAYYFRDTPGLVRAGVFYKTTSNNFTNVFFNDADDGSVRQEVLDYFGDLATARPELVAFDDGTQFLRNRPENGEGGKIYGFELELIRQLDFLPGFLGDFGVLGNLTYTKGDFPTLVLGRNDAGDPETFSIDRALADQAAWVYNASLNYQRGGFEGRLIYTYQDASVKTFEVHGLDTIEPDYATLDLRLSYDLPISFGDLTVYLQGDDLLRDSDEPSLRSAVSSQFNDGPADFFYPGNFQFTGGRTVTAGIRARF